MRTTFIAKAVSTTHFLDIHLLGTPEAIKASLARVRRTMKRHVDEDNGDVMPTPAAPLPSADPWPGGMSHCVQGVAFEARDLTRETLFKKILSAALGPGKADLECAAVVHYAFGSDAVSLGLATPANPEPALAMSDDPILLEEGLGMALEDALDDDEVLDAIGDKMLPHLLTSPGAQAALAPLFAADRASALDGNLDPATAPRRAPRV